MGGIARGLGFFRFLSFPKERNGLNGLKGGMSREPFGSLVRKKGTLLSLNRGGFGGPGRGPLIGSVDPMYRNVTDEVGN